MPRRFQFSLSKLFWAMFGAAIVSGSWQLARYVFETGPVESALLSIPIAWFLLTAAASYADYVATPLDEWDE